MKKLESQPVFRKTARGGRKMARKYRSTSLYAMVSHSFASEVKIEGQVLSRTPDEPWWIVARVTWGFECLYD